MDKIKFDFSPEFQFEILRYTALDKNGNKIVNLYDDSYFTLLEHSVIAYTFRRYYKKHKRVPGKPVMLDEINNTFNSRQFVNNLTDDDHKKVLDLVKNKLYKRPVQDGDDIIKKTERFSQFVDLKHEIENVNLLDFDSYDVFAKKVQKAISPRLAKLEERGSFLIKDIRYRQLKRKDHNPIIPTPYRQLNRLTNAGGYSRGSILVVADLAKRFKTGALVNIALGYLKMFNVLVIDLDNGEDEFMMRVEQSMVGKTKSQLLSGDHDKSIQKSMRRRKRLGRELIVKKMPSLITNAQHIGNYIDYLYSEYGIRVEILIIDYIGKMGCVSGKESLHERVGEAYIDVSNLALEKGIIHVWTGAHINKEGEKRSTSRYKATDLAASLDISRHVQAMFGLNRTEAEDQNNLQRMEIIDQRDGKPNGRAVFGYNRDTQRMWELSGEELKDYQETYTDILDESDEDEISYKGNRRRKGGDLN